MPFDQILAANQAVSSLSLNPDFALAANEGFSPLLTDADTFEKA